MPIAPVAALQRHRSVHLCEHGELSRFGAEMVGKN
jgi:hypothetical protein